MKKYLLGLYEKSMPGTLTWAEKLQAAKNAGFDYVEMSIDETDDKLARLDFSEGEIDEIRAAMRTVNLPFRSICLSGHRKYPFGSHNKDTQKRSMEIMQKAVIFAAKLGIRTIQLAGYDVYYEDGDDQTRADFLENLKLATEMATKEGVMLGFETMETPFMDTVGKAMHYVDIVNSPYLGVYPDVGNITNAALLYKTDVLEDLKSGKGHISAVHLKETVPGKYREIPYGTGHVDFEKVIKTSWDLGVRRFVTEFWYVKGVTEDWKAELDKANSFIRGYFDKIVD
ncbi:MAG: L-ribulose-5-phosphate 3-epimerase [Selenomonadaceae bacterium]|nr:L-ribulose-5-phosphate 3-epimerase [Selenomonadaceae bacterium]